jgi:hypothetical protein
MRVSAVLSLTLLLRGMNYLRDRRVTLSFCNDGPVRQQKPKDPTILRPGLCERLQILLFYIS